MANLYELTWTNSPAFDTLDSQQVEGAAGEDQAWAFTLDDGTVNVSAWTIEFNVAPSDNRNPVITVASGSITKGSTGNISFSTLKAVTEVLPPRNYYWELLRTDSGNRKVLAFGNWTVTGSPSLYPGVVIGPTIIPLSKGGTGSDLSEEGPGVLIQATAEANVTTLEADLSNTTLYLRKDLTWQLPTGSVPGTVTSVSVVTANGISGTVATATTTPAITLTLGAITPTSVNSVVISGSSTPTLVVTGSSAITGTNTGDQTNISGNAATVSVIDASADTTTWPMLATAQTGNLSPATDAGITYDATTNSLTLGVAGASLGSLVLAGNTSGYVQINTAAAAGSWTLTLPANNGDSGQFLQTDGNGVSSWATVSTTAAAITVANEASDTSCFLGFFTAATGDLGPKTNAALTFNSATANLGCTTFTGALVGNATTATTLATPRAIYGNNFDGSAALTGPATIATSTTTPKLIGGTTTTSTLTLQPTSGAGTTGADIVFAVGNNGATEAMRILNSGRVKCSTAIEVTSTSYFIGNATNGFRFNKSGDALNLLKLSDNATVCIGTGSNYAGGGTPAFDNGLSVEGKVQIGHSSGLLDPPSLFNVGSGYLFQVDSSGRLFLPAGASGAGNLALSFVGDTNTGFYRSAADEMAFQCGGATVLTVNTGGITVAGGSANAITSTALADFNAGYFVGSASAGQSYGVRIDAGTNSTDRTFLAASKAGTAYFHIRGDGKSSFGNGTAFTALVNIGKAGTTLGTLAFEGSTSGYVQIQPAAAAGSWTLTLPPDDGTVDQHLRTDGSGVTTWVKPLAVGAAGALTIASGVVTVTKSFHVIDTEAAAASDDLDTINGGSEGDVLVIRAANSARDVVVKNGTGNIKLAGSVFTMDETNDKIVLIFDGANWTELARSSNSA